MSGTATSVDRQGARRPRVLLVDDSPIYREVLRRTLRHPMAGQCEVLEASDGRHALELLVDHDIDLVIADVQMPNMTGSELVEALRSTDRYAQTPVVVVSALRDEAEERRLQLLGVTAYLYKPVFVDALLSAVRLALSPRHSASVGLSEELLLEVASDVLEDFARLIVDRAPRELEWEGPVLHSEIAFSGSLVGSLGLLAPSSLMQEVACGLLGLDAAHPASERNASDTLAELSSVLLGALLARALREDCPRQLGLPVVGTVRPGDVPCGSRSLLLWDPAGRPLRIDVTTLLEDVR